MIFILKVLNEYETKTKEKNDTWHAAVESESESDVTYSQVWWPILGICALHLKQKCFKCVCIQSAHTHHEHTHTPWTHTHTMNTHPEQWAVIYVAAPGEQLGVQCLAQGHLSRGIEGGESAGHSLPPPTIPAGPETRTHNLWTSLTL